MKIILKNLTKKFPGRGRKSEDVIAVNNFDFEVPDGKLIGLLGPSGCGKSTTLNLICGLLKPTDGQIFFGEEDVTNLPPEKRGVGLVFQNYALYPHLTVLKNITFPLENLRGTDKLSKEEMEQRALETAKLVQIEGLMDRKPSELSGGQQQRVAIARALVKMPKVLLLDEPLSNLDARLRLQTREEIRRIQKQTGITTVFVTHDQDEAMSISDLIVVMKDGLVQQIGKPQDVYDNPVNLFVAKFLGTPPINVFTGHVKDETLYIGKDAVLPARGISDREVSVGIRPEGFIPDPDGKLVCNLSRVEVMGRDVSVVSSHEDCENAVIRSIIGSDVKIDVTSPTVSFSLKPHKVYLFEKESGERLVWLSMEKQNGKGWLYLLPAFLFLGVFMIYPLIDVFVYSFEEGYNSASQTFFGTGTYNYSYVLHDPYFLQALKNTFLLVIITVPLSTLFALLISAALSSIKKLRELFQTIYFLPYVTNTLAVGLVFMILFKKTAYSEGLINLLINWFGGPSVDFIDGPYWAKMFVLCFYTIWVVMPFKILILTSALSSVNPMYYNAAKVDGTSPFRIFYKITLPMISPMLFYLIITGFIGAFKAYSDAVALFGTDLNAAEMNTIVGYVYDMLYGDSGGYPSYASAAAIILFAIVLTITCINLLVSKKHVHYV